MLQKIESFIHFTKKAYLNKRTNQPSENNQDIIFHDTSLPYMEVIKKNAEDTEYSRVLIQAFEEVFRENFVPTDFLPYVHLDKGFMGLLTEPSLMFDMIYFLNLTKDKTVLEIGSGTGFNTAILALIAKQVYTVEQNPQRAHSLEINIRALGIDNVTFLQGDGAIGWAKHAPYDAILFTAAINKFTDEITSQLADRGRAIAPTGRFIRRTQQIQGDLTVAVKDEYGNVKKDLLSLYEGSLHFAPVISPSPSGWTSLTRNHLIPSDTILARTVNRFRGNKK